MLEVAPGDSRIIAYLSIAGGSGDEDGAPCSFNDLGQVAFFASFTDGSQGIFIATPAVSINTFEKAGKTATITLHPRTGYSYQLQRFLSSLDSAGFINVGSPRSGNAGTTLTFADLDATGAKAFYRVVADPSPVK